MEKVTIVDEIDIYMEDVKSLRPEWTDDQCMKFMLSLKEPLAKIMHETVNHCLDEWAFMPIEGIDNGEGCGKLDLDMAVSDLYSGLSWV